MQKLVDFTKRVLPFLLILGLLLACKEEEEPANPVAGDPTENDDDEDNGDGNGSDNPLLWNPTAPLQNLADFPIGMIVSANRLASSSSDNQTFREILLEEYNSITAENDMKMANMFTAPDTYDWSDGDAIVAYAKANNLRVHGHTLVWHASVPGWLNTFEGTDSAFSVQIEAYVKATVAHFAQEKMTVNGEEVSVVAGWDVVNEIFEGSGLRNSIFRQRIGDDYAAKLFTWAREADPDVKLFYNDFNMEFEAAKRNSMLNMISNFKNSSIPIDGIGFQMHVNHDFPTENAIEDAVDAAVATGLLIHFSELDVKVNFNDDITELTQERAEAQEAQYRLIAEIYNTIPAAQQFGITIWGMRDVDSWLYNGGNDWPLMYDNDFNYKIAHRGFSEGLQND